MPASNIFQVAIALQNAKGQVVTTPQFWLDVTGSDLGPTQETERRGETGQGVDAGTSYIRVLGAGGSANVILRPSYAPLLLYGNLGAKAVSGTGPFTHTATAANTKPFFTVWRSVGDQLWEVFRDCHFTGMNIQWSPGGDVTADMSIMGLDFERLTAPPAGGVYAPNEAPFRVPGRTFSVDGGPGAAITEGNVNIEWPSNPIQTGDITYSYLEPGQRAISASWTEVWESVARYAKTVYGSASGTEPATTSYEAAFSFGFPHATTGHSLTLSAPRFRFDASNPTPNTGGDPLMLPIAGTVERPATGSILTGAVGNGVASYPAAA